MDLVCIHDGASSIDLPEVLPVIPIRGAVMFPYLTAGLAIGTPELAMLVKLTVKGDHLLLVVAQKDSNCNNPGCDDIFKVGVVSYIHRINKVSASSIYVVVQGLVRAKIVGFCADNPRYARVKPLDCTISDVGGENVDAMMRKVTSAFKKMVSAAPYLIKNDLPGALRVIDPGKLADYVACHLDLGLQAKQKLLESSRPDQRLKALNEVLDDKLRAYESERMKKDGNKRNYNDQGKN